MSDGYVQAPADNTGKLVDADEIVTTSGTVERLRIEIPGIVSVGGDLLTFILAEIRLTNDLLGQAFNLSDELEEFRNMMELE